MNKSMKLLNPMKISKNLGKIRLGNQGFRNVPSKKSCRNQRTLFDKIRDSTVKIREIIQEKNVAKIPDPGT